MSRYNSSKSLDGPMYKALTSKSPTKRIIAKAILSLSKLSGSEKRVEKSNIKKQKDRKNKLKEFLEENDTIQKLNNININPQLFTVAVIRNYTSDVSDFKKSFEKLIKYAIGKKINSRKINNIAERMVSKNFTLEDDDFLKSEDEIKLSKSRLSKTYNDDDDIQSKSTLNSNSDIRLSNSDIRKLYKLKINNEMTRSLPNISEISPFLPFQNKLGQVGAALKIKRLVKKRSIKKPSTKKKNVSKKHYTKKRSVKKPSTKKKNVSKKHSTKKRSVKKHSTKKNLSKKSK
jgi:hypothetical protein